MSLGRVKKDIERYLNERAYNLLNIPNGNRTIEIRERERADLRRVKIFIDNNFKIENVVEFNTDPRQFLNLMKNQRNCDYNFIIEDINGKTFCFLVELKTTIYDDDLTEDDKIKGQIKSIFIYIYMLSKFLDLSPEFRAIVFYKNDKRSKTVPPTEIDPYIQRETDIGVSGGYWDFKLPKNKLKTIKFALVKADNDQTFNLSYLATLP